MHNLNDASTTCIKSMKLLGDYWTLRIIDALSSGEVRFCELQRIIDNINPATLTSRLKKLEASKLIIRNQKTLDKISVTYALTPHGYDAIPVIEALNNFSSNS